ncbi:flagellar motor protein MotD [Endozoicomonas sp. SM1973]|uniref:Flagellar motor protein MotD n=1 Tax=Spartinivicinus marinus TaxID=2994442 RepID=A0A853I1Y2_9GAMM|nr:flagellar motor protein MotD [Spartinivicinus marinus]MCX4028945.1 flagellar motor protein MotD [Spartinivicinus marinus]NYZ65472.1 flagellar motor protein MotD [Spartinivicinus marinus]
MPRRRMREEHENHERWLVSYADFITLLFAFFVVMYSISSVNEGKYRILSETLVGVFSEPDRSLKPIQIGDITQRFPDKPVDIIQVPDAFDMTLDDSKTEQPQDDTLAQLESQFSETFSDLISKDLLTITGNELWVEIELKSNLLFLSGDSIPSNAAFDIIKQVADILKNYQNPLHIEGFTDNRPINTNQFPTNWELSAARAAAVVRLLASYGVDPRRMAAVGYGQFQPITTNDTPEGRRQNRRVILVISKNLDVRNSVNTAGGRNNPARP